MDDYDDYDGSHANNRKKWGKPQNAFIPDQKDERKQVSATSGTLNYIAQLEAKNREKKRLQEESLNPHEREMKEREKAFSTNWQGANKTQKKTSSSNEKKSAKKITQEVFEPQDPFDSRSRSKWSKNEQVQIKGSASPNTKKDDEYYGGQPKMFDDESDEDEYEEPLATNRMTLSRNDIAVLRQSLMSSSSVMTEMLSPLPEEPKSELHSVEGIIERMQQLDQSKQNALLKVI
jgi:hypothetical protein